jgi:hypothetical protein
MHGSTASTTSTGVRRPSGGALRDCVVEVDIVNAFAEVRAGPTGHDMFEAE